MRTRGLVAGVLVAALAPTLVATEAHGSAALGSSISLRVGKPRIDEGQSTLLRGHVRGFPRGSELRLDRWRRGAWVPRQTKVLKASHDYQFRVTPPHGDQQFRVSVTDRDGRRLEQATTVVVRWVPEMSARARWTGSDGDYTLLVRGSASYAGADRMRVRLQEWVESEGDWFSSPTLPAKVVDGRFTLTGYLLPGTRGRVLLRGNGGARLDSTAEFVVPPFDLESIVFTLNDPAGTGSPATASFVDNLIDLPPGQEVRLKGAFESDYREIVDPSGRALRFEGDGDIVTMTTTTAGRYVIRRFPGSSGALYASTTKTYQGALDEVLDVEPDVPGQALDVQLQGRAGEIIVVGPDAAWPSEILDPAGDPVLRREGVPFGLSLDRDGTYTARYRDGLGHTLDLRRVFQTTAEVDGPVVPLPEGEPAVVTIPGRAGQPFFLRTQENCYELQQLGARMYDADGVEADWLHDELPRSDGDYRLFVPSRDPQRARSVRIVSSTVLPAVVDGPAVGFSAPTPLCHSLRVSFAGSAGQFVRLSAQDSQDLLFSPEVLGADEQPLSSFGLSLYRLPTDAVYTARWSTQYSSATEEPWSAELAVTSVTPRPMPADGSQVSLASDPGTYSLIGHIDVPVGTRLTITMSDTDWPRRVNLYAPNGYLRGWVGQGQPTTTVLVNQEGGVYLSTSTSENSTATVTVTPF